jgi:hypothetical protein
MAPLIHDPVGGMYLEPENALSEIRPRKVIEISQLPGHDLSILEKPLENVADLQHYLNQVRLTPVPAEFWSHISRLRLF